MFARKLADLDWVTCATPEYLSRRAPLVHPTDLAADHRVIGYFSAATGRTMPLRYHSGGEEIAVDVSPELAVSESTAHLNTILLGLGVAQTYDFMARPHLQSGALVEVLADWKPESVPLYLLHPAIRSQSLKLRCFSDWVASLFQPD
jgi:DNA-binding transcriptional LysR family regulator